MPLIGRSVIVGRIAQNLGVVLYQDAVVQHRHISGLLQFAFAIETRGREDDVVALPLARFTASVDHRRPLIVHRGALPFGIGLIVVRIKHLNLIVGAHEADAVVAASLSLAFDLLGRGKFHVQLNVAEAPFGLDDSFDGETAVFVYFPPFRAFPLLETLAVEEHNGVGGRIAVLAWRHHRRLRPDDTGEIPLPQQAPSGPHYSHNDYDSQQPFPHRCFLLLVSLACACEVLAWGGLSHPGTAPHAVCADTLVNGGPRGQARYTLSGKTNGG